MRRRLACSLIGLGVVSAACAPQGAAPALGLAESAAASLVLTVQPTGLVPADPTDPQAADDRFGAAVDLDGQVALVGMPYNDVEATDSGTVYMFSRSLTGWTQRAKLNASPPVGGARFGWSVGLSGQTVVVGAPYDSGGGGEAGAVHVIEPTLTTPVTWQQKVKIAGAPAARLGLAVAVDGDLAAIGGAAGAVSIRGRAIGAPPGWGQEKQLTGTAAAGFGEVLALAADLLAVGLPRDDTQAADAGLVQLYGRDQGGAAAWGLVVTIASPDAAAGDAFGSAVALDGDQLLVGAPGDDQDGVDAGAAYLFRRDQGGANAWGLVEKLRAAGAAAGDGLGGAVGLAGHTAVVAALGARRAQVFERDTGGVDAWGEVGTLARSAPAAGDRFGNAVAVSDDRVLVGEAETAAGPNQGAAHLFELVYLGQPCVWDTDCRSGHCVDQVCCNGACDAPCDGCVASKTGLSADGLCGTIFDGLGCDDGDLCTQTSTCDDGSCLGADPVACQPLDQCHDAGVCDPADGRCSNPKKADASPCDDGNPCTQTDTCFDGGCIGTQPVLCTPLDVCHLAGQCDPDTGQCSNPAKPDDAPCSDQNACTRVDRCVGGSCVGANAIVCLPLDACHDAGVCNPTTGQCSNPSKEDGTPCDDQLFCTVGETCQSGVCRGSMRSCAVGVSCRDGACNELENTCSGAPLPDGGGCDDGDPCTFDDSCAGGACAGVPYSCADQLPCTDDRCLGDGTCVFPERGGACDDGDPCSHSDACTGGSCAGVAYSCDDGNTCTADACLGNGTCSRVELSGPCDDGDACTAVDVCAQGRCVGQSPVLCAALDACHAVGVCDPATGLCSNPPRLPGTPCDDGLFCTVNDQCQEGSCAGVTRACVAGVSCRDGSCDEQNDRCDGAPLQDGWSCDDGDACTYGDACSGGDCQGTSYGCDDGKVCTEDVCDGSGGCLHRAENGPCDDGLACTFADTCRFGACVGVPYACNDGNACTTDSCNSDGTCTFAPNTQVCDDGDPCTVGDRCGDGVCHSGVWSCDDSGQLVDGGGEDGGPTDDGEPQRTHKPGGCGCRAEVPSPGLAVALVAVVGLRARRRRRAGGQSAPARD